MERKSEKESEERYQFRHCLWSSQGNFEAPKLDITNPEREEERELGRK